MPSPSPGKMYALFAGPREIAAPAQSTAPKGLPLAKTTRPPVAAYAWSAVHSAWDVGLDIANTMGRGLHRPAPPAAPPPARPPPRPPPAARRRLPAPPPPRPPPPPRLLATAFPTKRLGNQISGTDRDAGAGEQDPLPDERHSSQAARVLESGQHHGRRALDIVVECVSARPHSGPAGGRRWP